MDSILAENASFDNLDFSEQLLRDREYSKCVFTKCDFSKSNLKNTDFIDCAFNGCNFSLAQMDNTGLKNVTFTGCKLIGISFSACSNFLFSVSFKDCHLDYSSFFQKKMKKTGFTNCSLKEVDLEEADLSAATFNNCDLMNARFIHTILEKADFRTATNYSFDPEINKIKKAKFAYHGISGLLAKYDIDIEVE